MFNIILILAGLAVAAGVARWLIRRAWGPLKGVCVELTPTTSRRTAGEVHQELWEQKGTLDRAIQATTKATIHQSKFAAVGTYPREIPSAPCEVEP